MERLTPGCCWLFCALIVLVSTRLLWKSWLQSGRDNYPNQLQEKITLSAVLTVAQWIFMYCWRCRRISRWLLFAEYQLLHFHVSTHPRQLWRRRPDQRTVCVSAGAGFCLWWFSVLKARMQPSSVMAPNCERQWEKKNQNMLSGAIFYFS